MEDGWWGGQGVSKTKSLLRSQAWRPCRCSHCRMLSGAWTAVISEGLDVNTHHSSWQTRHMTWLARRWTGSNQLQNRFTATLICVDRPIALTADRLGNVGLSVVAITTILILPPYRCERLKSILNFLNSHSFHQLCCASWNFISAWAPGGIESAQTAPEFEQ